MQTRCVAHLGYQKRLQQYQGQNSGENARNSMHTKQC